MTVKSKREINRGLCVGGVFILLLTGVPYTVGALSNVYFHNNESVVGKIQNREQIEPLLGQVPPEGTSILIWAEDGKKEIKVPLGKETEITWGKDNQQDIVYPHLISIARTGGARDQIIPTFITTALPRWFGIVFLLSLLSAAMSTLSGLLHVMGTSIGRDVFEQVVPRYSPTDRQTVMVTRIGIIIGLIVSLILAAKSLRGYIAIATALFWKRMTRLGAIVSMLGGFIFSMFWMLFVFEQTAKPIGLCTLLTGQTTLWQSPNWPVVDPIVIGLPFSILLAVVVSLCTRPPDKQIIDRCFT